MKRALVLILSLALVMCIAIPALAADDVEIYDFTNTADVDDTFGFNTGLTTSFGVPAPTVTIENGQMKMLFNHAIAGGYLRAESRSWVATLAEKAADYKYLRLYVENNTSAAFAISFMFEDAATGWGSADMTKAVLINTDGEKVTGTVRPDYNGFTNGYIELPAGFKGWLFMDANVSTFGPGPDGWGKTALNAWSDVTFIEWDIRDAAADGEGYMIWDDLALVNEAAAPEASEPGTDNPGNGGDISMLLYAAAAVSGLGALAIRRKK